MSRRDSINFCCHIFSILKICSTCLIAPTVRFREPSLCLPGEAILNLTTIDWQKADADVQRILDSATGQFYDDFAKRSGPFIELVKQAKSVSVGTVSEAGLESQTADSAQVLVAVSVTTSYSGAPQPDPHAWRMRISVQKVGGQEKVSNVEFVP